MLERGFDQLARLLFVAIALARFALASSLMVAGTWQLVRGAFSGELDIYSLMNAVGLLIVSLPSPTSPSSWSSRTWCASASCARRPKRCAR